MGNSSWRYGPLALSANHSIGITSWLTPGYRLEATESSVSGGPQVTLGFPFGQAQFVAAGSDDQGQSGAAASFLYQYISPQFGADSEVQWMSPHYSNLSESPAMDRPIVQTNSSATYAFKTVSIGLQHIYAQDRNNDGGQSVFNQISTSMLWAITQRLNLSVTLAHSLPNNQIPANEAFVALSYALNDSTTATVSYTDQQSQSSAVGSLQRNLPYGPGYGYLLQAQGGQNGQQQEAALLQYQTDKGYYQANYYRQDNQDFGSATLAGGIIGIGRRLFLTRPVENGFALVRVPGVKDVECEWSNQSVGVTDGAGDCLYPNLLPYYGNQLGINDRDVPLNYSIGATQKIIAVPYRGGAIVGFPVHKLHQVVGKLVVIEGGKRVAVANGQLTVYAKPEQTSPIGSGGDFYFQDLPTGSFKAQMVYKAGTCSFEIVVPEFDEPLHKMGTLACTRR